MRSVPGLPDALEGVKTRAEWSRRRVELKGLVEKWLYGTMPPAPGNVRAKVREIRGVLRQ